MQGGKAQVSKIARKTKITDQDHTPGKKSLAVETGSTCQAEAPKKSIKQVDNGATVTRQAMQYVDPVPGCTNPLEHTENEVLPVVFAHIAPAGHNYNDT